MLDLVFTSKEGVVRNMQLKGRLCCSDHKAVKFQILGIVRSMHTKLTTLEFRRADWALFRDLLGKMLWA